MSFSTVYQLVDPPPKSSSFSIDLNILRDWQEFSVSEFFRHFSNMEPTNRRKLEEMLNYPSCGDPLQFYLLPHNLWDPHHFLRVCFLLAEGQISALQAWTFIPRPGFDCKLQCEPHDASGTVEVQVIQQRPGHKIEMCLQLTQSGRVLQPPNWLSHDPIVTYEFDNILDWSDPSPSALGNIQNPASGSASVSPFHSVSQEVQDATARFDGDFASIPLSTLNTRPVSGFSWLGPLSPLEPNAPQASNHDNVAPQNPQLHNEGASFNRNFSFLDRWLANVPSASNLLPSTSTGQLDNFSFSRDRAQDSIIERVADKASPPSGVPADNLDGVPAVLDENLVPTEPNSPVLQATPADTPDLDRVPTLVDALGPALRAHMSHPAGSTGADKFSTNGKIKQNSAAGPNIDIARAIQASRLQSFSDQKPMQDGDSHRIERFNSLASGSGVGQGVAESVAEGRSSDVHPPEDASVAEGGMDVDTQAVESGTMQ